MSDVSNAFFRIDGRVTDRKTFLGVPGLRVEARDAAAERKEPLATTATQRDGTFHFEFGEADLAARFRGRDLDLAFRVLDGAKLLFRGAAVRGQIAQRAIEVAIEVDSGRTATDAPTLPNMVRGELRDARGRALPGMPVQAFLRRLRSEQVVGKAVTDKRGAYEIAYDPGTTDAKVGGRPALLVKAFDTAGSLLATSTLRFSPASLETIHLSVGAAEFRPESELDRLAGGVATVVGTIPVTDLKAEELLQVIGGSDVEAEALGLLTSAQRMGQRAGLSANVLYALFRQGFPVSLPALVVQDRTSLNDALQRAIDDNLVAGVTSDEVGQFLERLPRIAAERAFLAPDIPGGKSLAPLLALTPISRDQQVDLLARFTSHTGTVEEFWKSLRDAQGFGAQAVERVQLTFQLAGLALNHAPLVDALMRHSVDDRPIASLRDLVPLVESDWVDLVTHAGVPRGVPGADAKEQARNYAATAVAILEHAFPTPVLADRIRRDEKFPVGRRGDVAAFLAANPDFEFQSDHLDTYLEAHPDALAGAEDVPGTQLELRRLQRVFRLSTPTGRTTVVRTLLAEGMDSAWAVSRLGKAAFADTFGATLGTERANLVYTQANERAAIALNVFGRASSSMNAFGIYAIGGGPEEINGLADLRTLFGPLEMCECEHCRSVYSPAAYLVDILQFIRQRTTNGKRALDVLFERRADLGAIELNCDNTNVPLPYIDLVNEALENTIVPGPPVPQTGGTAAQLRVHPEHLNEAAYDVLGLAIYPWNLPFHLWSAEARLYLQHLGVPRFELMELFRRAGAPPRDVDIAGEQLGLSPLERTIIVGGLAGHAQRDFWGMVRANWVDELSHVPRFLEQSELTYPQLQELLECRYLNPHRAIAVSFPRPDCDLTDATLTHLAEADLVRFHRFERLGRKLGWKTFDLDAAILTFPARDLSPDCLIALAEIRRLQGLVRRTPIRQMLSWWSQLDTVSRGDELSLYEEIFLNPTVIHPNDPAYPHFVLSADRTELQSALVGPPPTLGDHLAPVLGALGIREDEFRMLADAFLVGDLLNLENLSTLYRNLSLARALKLSIRDFVTLRSLTGADPFDASDVPATRRFVELARRTTTSGFKLEQLDYLLAHRARPSSPFAPGDDQIGQVLDQIRSGLQFTAGQYQFVPDPFGSLTSQTLAIVLPPVPVILAMVMLANPGVRTAAEATEQTLFIDTHFSTFLDPVEARARLVGTPPAGPGLTDLQARFEYVLERLLNYLRRTASESLVIQRATDAFGLSAETTQLLLTQLVPSQAAAPGTNRVITDFLTLADTPATTPITAAAFPDPFNAFRLLHKIGALLKKFDIPDDEVERVFTAGPSLGWLDLAHLPLATPIPGRINALFEDWLRQADFVRLRRALPGGEPALLDLLLLPTDATVTESAFRAALVQRTGWIEADLQFLMGPQGYNLAYPADYLNQNALARLEQFQRAFEVRARLGIPAATLFAWNAVDVTPTMARDVKQAVKAKHDESAWLKVAQAIRDELREKQRAALAAHLLAHPHLVRPTLRSGSQGAFVRELQQRLNAVAGSGLGLTGDFGATTVAAVNALRQGNGLAQNGTADAPVWEILLRGLRLADTTRLYEYLLIDPEMSACMMTSRIKQAISSVQLFVQRCFLNLEPDVHLLPGDAEEWKWKKAYRVWEANRKIFLYPENWIEPELRDGKSPFYVDLETELLQGEVTDQAVEEAFVRYAENLHDVAHLEVAGVYHQLERDERGTVDTDLLHVVARTRTSPHVHYYRQRVDGAYWTPWLKIDLDIVGDHLIPVVYNRVLHLMWAVFQEKPDESQNLPSGSGAGEPAEKLWEISLAWSHLRSGKWMAKKLSRSALVSNYGPPHLQLARRQHHFRTFVDSATGDLVVRCVQNFVGTGIVGDFRLLACSGEVIVQSLSQPEPGCPLHYVWCPPNTAPRYMGFHENIAGKHPFELWVGQVSEEADYTELSDNTRSVKLLETPPDRFDVMVPHQDRQFLSQRPFFYQDRDRGYFVIPRTLRVPIRTPDRDLGFTVSLGSDYREAARIPDFVTPHMVDTIAFLPQGAYPSGLPVTPGTATTRSTSIVLANPDVRRTTGNALRVRGASPTARREATGVTSRAVDQMLRIGVKSPGNLAIGTPLFSADAWLGLAAAVTPVWYRTVHRWEFQTFYHPYTCLMLRELKRGGIDGLLKAPPVTSQLTLHRQMIRQVYFGATYAPTPVVATPRPVDQFDFSYEGAYSLYNWEVFFHAPFLIANRLSQNRRFEEAQRWYHYIFDPTDTSPEPVPARFWKIRPFYEEATGLSIQQLLLLLGKTGLTAEEIVQRRNLIAQIRAWTKDPFKPHVIARLRQLAYQKAVVMKYLDNLIAWGDDLFRRDTIEAINEATQLYLLAGQILGKRPETVTPPAGTVPTIGGNPVRTYNDLAPFLDEFSNAVVDLETAIPVGDPDPGAGEGGEGGGGEVPAADVLGPSLYFCIPRNDRLITYWNTVEDRLFKIRHCMNIQGVVRQLPLFEPPIDPGMLVRAAAAGIDVGSLFLAISASVPPYRFEYMVQKANEFNTYVRTLGMTLLGVLANKDFAALSELQSGQALTLQRAMRDIRTLQIDIDNTTLEGLQIGRDMSTHQRDVLRSRVEVNDAEKAQLILMGIGAIGHIVAAGIQGVAMGTSAIPDFMFGAAGGFSSPVMLTMPGVGEKISKGTAIAAAIVELLAKLSDISAQMTGIMASYGRRKDEWNLQADIADFQVQNYERQIVAQQARVAMAERNLEIHDLQITQAEELQTFFLDRFTNQELYGWMITQIANVYFQAYELAVDLARKSEQCYRFEIGEYEASFIGFGHFDNLRKGLLAADRLELEIRQMQSAYIDRNKREYEITKNFLLSAVAPSALVALKSTGLCEFVIPESALDLDYPGHYFRRIKMVSLTVPAERDTTIASFNCTLTYLSGAVRISPDPNPAYERDGEDALRFRDFVGPVQSIATSNGMGDSGAFQLTFFDQRYFPFEYIGLVDSSWRIEIRKDSNNFNLDSIFDVVLQVKYTARDGGETLRTAARAALEDSLDTSGLARLFSGRIDSAIGFAAFTSPAGTNTLTLDWSKPRFPLQFAANDIEITGVTLLLGLKPGFTYNDAQPLVVRLSGPGGANFTNQSFQLAGSPITGLPAVAVFSGSSQSVGEWTLQVLQAGQATTDSGPAPVHPEAIFDIWILVQYRVT